MKNLIGKTIKKIFVDDKEQGYLKFETEQGNLFFQAVGDCCSESYFSDINRIDNLINEKVIGVEEVELMPEEYTENESRQDSDEVYGFRIHTNKGTGLIIMRNSSNGYYGGELVEMDEMPEEIKLTEITKDYCSRDKKL